MRAGGSCARLRYARRRPSDGTQTRVWLRVLLCELLVAGPLLSSLSQLSGPRVDPGAPTPRIRPGPRAVFGPVHRAYQSLCTKGQPKAGPDASLPKGRTQRVPLPLVQTACVKTLSHKTSVNYPRAMRSRYCARIMRRWYCTPCHQKLDLRALIWDVGHVCEGIVREM